MSATSLIYLAGILSGPVEQSDRIGFFIPEPTARSAVPGVSPGRGLLIPHGYLHPGKCEHSEVLLRSVAKCKVHQ